MGRNPGHRHFDALAHTSGCKDDIQVPRCQAGVLVEGLIEIPQAKEHNGIRVALLDSKILVPDGGQRSPRIPGI